METAATAGRGTYAAATAATVVTAATVGATAAGTTRSAATARSGPATGGTCPRSLESAPGASAGTGRHAAR